jgi:hypothetical protein
LLRRTSKRPERFSTILTDPFQGEASGFRIGRNGRGPWKRGTVSLSERPFRGGADHRANAFAAALSRPTRSCSASHDE